MNSFYCVLTLVSLVYTCRGFSKTCTNCTVYCGCVNEQLAFQLDKEQVQVVRTIVACEQQARKYSQMDQVDQCMIAGGYIEPHKEVEIFEVNCPSCPLASAIMSFERSIGSRRQKRSSSDREVENSAVQCVREQLGKEWNRDRIDEVYTQFYRNHPERIMEHCYAEHCGRQEALRQCLAQTDMSLEAWQDFEDVEDKDYSGKENMVQDETTSEKQRIAQLCVDTESEENSKETKQEKSVEKKLSENTESSKENVENSERNSKSREKTSKGSKEDSKSSEETSKTLPEMLKSPEENTESSAENSKSSSEDSKSSSENSKSSSENSKSSSENSRSSENLMSSDENLESSSENSKSSSENTRSSEKPISSDENLESSETHRSEAAVKGSTERESSSEEKSREGKGNDDEKESNESSDEESEKSRRLNKKGRRIWRDKD